MILELCVCPVCHTKGELGIKPKFADREQKRAVFYARCNQCGYETFDYDTTKEVIKYLYDRMRGVDVK